MNTKKIIGTLYNLLFFIVPLVLYPYTSELFEFNKMIVIYIFTVLILFFWLVRYVYEGKFPFKKTALDIPILLFLGSQTISTLVSLDVRTSIFGYYSRFNGGLLSLFCYSVLYWGYTANTDTKGVLTSIKVIFISTFISSVYGILEHFGIDKNVWIQDVQNRVFSTFGQPNWMAAWLVAVIPLTYTFVMRSKLEIKKLKNFNPLLSMITFFTALLFTKSRSGILGLAASTVTFWGLITATRLKNKIRLKTDIFSFLLINFTLLLFTFFIGSPWTPKISEIFSRLENKKDNTSPKMEAAVSAPVLEVGGSSSAEIRKIVWQGAVDVFKNYPLFGSGVETFAFSYYKFRPVSHNLVSEWDFLYNKAHNEYLNFMATTGSVGILSYIILIVSVLYLLYKLIFSKSDDREIIIALVSGYVSILVTNFFGFSVVPVNLLFYLFPAMAVVLSSGNAKESETGDSKKSDSHRKDLRDLDIGQKTVITVFAVIGGFLLISISRYWYADILYNKADGLAKSGNLISAVKEINSAIKLSPKEAVYHDELASDLTDIAVVYQSQGNTESAKRFSENAMKVISQAESISPNNLNIIRNKARIAIKLSEITPALILDAKKALLKGVEMAPTEAKLYYNLSLTYYRIGDIDNATEILKKTVEMKANYKDARYAFAIILTEKGDKEEAKRQLRYILEKLDPTDMNARKALEEIDTP